jgi:hypothetical protein
VGVLNVIVARDQRPGQLGAQRLVAVTGLSKAGAMWFIRGRMEVMSGKRREWDSVPAAAIKPTRNWAETNWTDYNQKIFRRDRNSTRLTPLSTNQRHLFSLTPIKLSSTNRPNPSTR